MIERVVKFDLDLNCLDVFVAHVDERACDVGKVLVNRIRRTVKVGIPVRDRTTVNEIGGGYDKDRGRDIRRANESRSPLGVTGGNGRYLRRRVIVGRKGFY